MAEMDSLTQKNIHLDTNMSKIGPGTTILAFGADIPVLGTSRAPKGPFLT